MQDITGLHTNSHQIFVGDINGVIVVWLLWTDRRLFTSSSGEFILGPTAGRSPGTRTVMTAY